MWKRCCMHRETTRKYIRWISIVLLCTMLLCACGAKPPATSPGDGDKAGGNDAPINGGSINIVMPANPDTLDPLEVASREMVDLFGTDLRFTGAL